MQQEIMLENIKCGGCAGKIRQAMEETEGVTGVDVDIESGRVSFQAEAALKETLGRKLLSLGYPEIGSIKGMRSGMAKARSFVSCAVGRLDNRRERD